jgi:hypothetical protein
LLVELKNAFTDGEIGFRNSIIRYLPNIPLLRCWKHLWSSLTVWVKHATGKESDIGIYITSVHELLLQPTVEAYNKMLFNKKMDTKTTLDTNSGTNSDSYSDDEERTTTPSTLQNSNKSTKTANDSGEDVEEVLNDDLPGTSAAKKNVSGDVESIEIIELNTPLNKLKMTK